MIARLNRALTQKMYLLNLEIKSENECHYSVLGSRGTPYDVIINEEMSCTCIDFTNRHKICKHIMFIVCRVYEKSNLLITEDANINLYSLGFKNEFCNRVEEKKENKEKNNELKDIRDSNCSICYEECLNNTENAENLIDACMYCKNPFHKECISIWLSKKQNCPLCRSIWKIDKIEPNNEQDIFKFYKR